MALSLTGAKIIAMVCQMVILTVFCLLPIKVSAWMQRMGEKGEILLSCCRCFGGGALLGSYMLHMTPEIRYLLEVSLLHPQNIYFPVPEALAGAGFFLFLFIEWGVTLLDVKEETKAEQKRNSRWVEQGVISEWLSTHSLDPIREVPEVHVENENGENGANNNTTATFRTSTGVQLRHPPSSTQVNQSPSAGVSRVRHSFHSGRLTADVSNHNSGSQAHSFHSGRLSVYQTAPQPPRGSRDSYRASRHDPVAARVSVCPLSIAEQGETDTPTQAMAEPENSSRSFILLIALSADGLLQGLAVGLQRTHGAVWALLISVVSHEFVVAFCLGLELVRTKPMKQVVISSLVYGLMPAIGTGIGIILFVTSSDPDDPTSGYLMNGILQSLATGVFLYVAFVGILGEELTSHPTIWALLSVVAGWMLLALLSLTHSPEDPPPNGAPPIGGPTEEPVNGLFFNGLNHLIVR